MKKKKKVDEVLTAEDWKVVDRINAALARMNHRELKIQCIQMGMSFEKVTGSSHHDLASFFYEHFNDDYNVDSQILNEYDAWLEPQIKDPAIKNSRLKYGFVTDEKIQEHKKEIKDIKTVIPKTEKIVVKAQGVNEQTGVRAGTKKDLTYKLTKDKLPLDKIIAQVTEAFPDANEKSIKIWVGRAKKQ